MAGLLMRFAARLPLPLLHAAGSILGWIIYLASPRYRKHLRDNLATAGYRDAATRCSAIAHAGKMIAELPALWLRPQAEVLALVRGVRGWEQAEAARAAGKGIIFLTPHLGCFEMAPKVVAGKIPIAVLYRAPKFAWLQPMIDKGRGQHNVRLARADRSGVRELLAALLRKEAVLILPDQVPGEGEGEWVEFFGKPTYTMTLAARLAARPGRECLLMFGERLPGGGGYLMHVRPLPAAEPGESGARRINRALEALIRECPGQYLWGYNRYKHPKGAPEQRPVDAPEQA